MEEAHLSSKGTRPAILAAKALVRNEGKLLVLKRGQHKKPFPRYWGLAGGKVEEAEDLVGAVHREIKEETGLDVEIVGVPRNIDLAFDGVARRYIVYDANASSIDVQLSCEHTESRWVGHAEAVRLQTEPLLRTFLEEKR